MVDASPLQKSTAGLLLVAEVAAALLCSNCSRMALQTKEHELAWFHPRLWPNAGDANTALRHLSNGEHPLDDSV